MAEAAFEAEAAFAEGREAAAIAIPSGATWRPQAPSSVHVPDVSEIPDIPDEKEEEEQPDEEPLVDVEHLQLTLQEAFFLLWNLDCLTILDPVSVCIYSMKCYLVIYLSLEAALEPEVNLVCLSGSSSPTRNPIKSPFCV